MATLDQLFEQAALTASVRTLYAPQRKTQALGLYRAAPQASNFVKIQYAQGRIFLVPAKEHGQEPTLVGGRKDKAKILETVRLPVGGSVQAGDVSGFIAIGSDTQLKDAAAEVNDRLLVLKQGLQYTEEWQFVSGLGGKILDADGSVLVDLFDEFGVTKKTVVIAFSSADTDVRSKVMEGKRHAEKKLNGQMVTEYRAYCSPEFFDAFTGHAKVQAAFANWQAAADALGGDVRKGFRFGDVIWEEYNAEISGQRFIPAGKARMFPVGTDMFQVAYAPPQWMSTVNKRPQSDNGSYIYASAEPRKHGAGYDLLAELNMLAVPTLPDALVEFGIA